MTSEKRTERISLHSSTLTETDRDLDHKKLESCSSFSGEKTSSKHNMRNCIKPLIMRVERSIW